MQGLAVFLSVRTRHFLGCVSVRWLAHVLVADHGLEQSVDGASNNPLA